MGVPVGDPGSDVLLQRLHAFVGAAFDLLLGQQPEPTFDLVDPGGPGRGEMHVEPGVLGQPEP